MADGTETKLPEIQQVGKAVGDTYSGNFREDPWMRIREIGFGDKSPPAVTVVVTIKGDAGGSGGGGTIVCTAAAVITGRAIKYGKNLGTVGFFVLKTDDPAVDLNTRFETEFDETQHRTAYVSYQTLIDRVLAKYPDALVVKSGIIRQDADGDTAAFNYINIVVESYGDVSYVDLSQSATATLLDAEPADPAITLNPLVVDFPVSWRASTSAFVITNTADVKAYGPTIETPDTPAAPPTFEAQSDGTIKVTGGRLLWSTSVSAPDGYGSPSTPVPNKDIVYKFNSKGLVA